ncbi:MAG: HPP family protein [Ramlibacter sp.]
MSTNSGFAGSLPSPAVPRVRGWIARLIPGPTGLRGREAWRAAVGAALGLLVAATFSRLLSAGPATAWLVAPLGASAVLAFAVPASPLAQPWSVVAGNTLSALVGIACANAIPDPAWAGGVAVGVAMLLMVRLRCLHPPGGAVALLMAITHVTGFHFALFPVLLNSLLLVLMGVVYNSATGHAYPRAQVLPTEPGLQPVQGRRFTEADLDVALDRFHEVVDISRADLHELLEHAEMAAYQRKLGALRCGDAMSRDPVSVQFGTPLREAWELMRDRRVKALPVVDRARRICGIVTTADFMRLADPGRPEGLADRLQAMLLPSGTTHSDKPEVVGQVMTRSVRVAGEDRPLADLVPIFAEDGHHHIPILDAEQRLAGMITQTDLFRTLLRTSQH